MKQNTARNSEQIVIDPLSSCVPQDAGPVRIIHDATLTRPLRIRDRAGVKLSPDAHAATAELLARVDDTLGPLEIFYLGAELPSSANGSAQLDAGRLGALPRLLFARAATSDALQGLDLEIRPRVRLVPGDGAHRALDATLDVHTDDRGDHARQTREALKAFDDWAARTWASCVASTLGPWFLASGITELRLRGTIRPDLRQQLAILSGQPWSEAQAD